EWLCIIWLAYCGASVGSFLNVVAWRVPRGESVNGRSHCPKCDHVLQARDNIPVLGWIGVRGRCRHCDLPVSSRYPIIEFMIGLCVTLVGSITLLSGQANFPLRLPVFHFELAYVRPEGVYFSIFLSVAICVTWSAALLAYDDRRIPLKMVGILLAFILVPLLIYPSLAVVPWPLTVPHDWMPYDPQYGFTGTLGYANLGMRILTAVIAGVFSALLIRPNVYPNADPKIDPLGRSTGRMIDGMVVLICASLIVGWQALPLALLIAIILAIVLGRLVPAISRGCRSSSLLAIFLPIATTIVVITWNQAYQNPWVPSVNCEIWSLLGCAVLIRIGSALIPDFSDQEIGDSAEDAVIDAEISSSDPPADSTQVDSTREDSALSVDPSDKAVDDVAGIGQRDVKQESD
ncbi:MAG: prepilin peptidase, partial [Planctomycetota bacterium]